MIEKVQRIIKTFEPPEEVVDMIVFKDRLFVATNKRVYILFEEKLVPLEMQNDPESPKADRVNY